MRLPRWPSLIVWIVFPVVVMCLEPTLYRAIRAGIILSVLFILRCALSDWIERKRS